MVDGKSAISEQSGPPQVTKAARFTAPACWDQQIWHDNPIFAELNALFPLAQCLDFPLVQELEQWRISLRPELTVSFIDNDQFTADGRYYENYIFDTNQIPTRYPNWHDMFGALIWSLFPKTKKLLNILHIQEIQRHGHRHRSLLRNKLTLFDECGVLVLFSPEAASVVDMLRNHQWTAAFVQNQHLWQGQSNQPKIAAMIFGHANYEMATRPFIGFTGKMLALAVPVDFFAQTLLQRIDFIDTALSEQIANQGVLVEQQQLTPLPLLGVPGWFEANKHPDFYQNTGYFRAKRTIKDQE